MGLFVPEVVQVNQIVDAAIEQSGQGGEKNELD
jgi:hypothetical protein